MSTNCVKCVTGKRQGFRLMCLACEIGLHSPLMVLQGLSPNLEEDVLMALRFLYYVTAKPAVPDSLYDASERQYLERPEVEDTPLMNPGSDNANDYTERQKVLALYLSLCGWEAGQRAGKKAAAATEQQSLF